MVNRIIFCVVLLMCTWDHFECLTIKRMPTGGSSEREDAFAIYNWFLRLLSRTWTGSLHPIKPPWLFTPYKVKDTPIRQTTKALTTPPGGAGGLVIGRVGDATSQTNAPATGLTIVRDTHGSTVTPSIVTNRFNSNGIPIIVIGGASSTPSSGRIVQGTTTTAANSQTTPSIIRDNFDATVVTSSSISDVLTDSTASIPIIVNTGSTNGPDAENIVAETTTDGLTVVRDNDDMFNPDNAINSDNLQIARDTE